MQAAQTIPNDKIHTHGNFGSNKSLDALARRAAFKLILGDKTVPPPNPERIELANALAEFVGETLRWKHAMKDLINHVFPPNDSADDTDDWIAKQLAKRRAENTETGLFLDQPEEP